MLEIDLRNRFLSKYDGEVNDPILNILLDTIEEYQKELQDELFLSAYTSWNNELSDGFFEILRKNMYGELYPGPAYSVVHSRLAQYKSSEPLFIDTFHHLSTQDEYGNKIFFSPHKPTWIVPNSSNSVVVDTENEDLLLGFNLWDLNSLDSKYYISLFLNNVEPMIIERLKCQIFLTSRISPNVDKKSVLRTEFPLVEDTNKIFFQTPFHSRFINIPIDFLKKKFNQQKPGDIVWIKFNSLGEYAELLDKNLIVNAFSIWNMMEKEMVLTKPIDKFKYKLLGMDFSNKETIVTGVFDTGQDPAIEYFNRSKLMNPSFPYQFNTYADRAGDAMILAINPPPKGNVKVKYMQYNLSDETTNIPSGKSFTLYRGLDEDIYSVQSILPTVRNNVVNNKKDIWKYFRNLVASRNRLITREDIRTAIISYPPFAANQENIHYDGIEFNEKTGRVRGFITTYTEIVVPVNLEFLLKSPEKEYFELTLGLYLKEKTINGNYLSVKFVESK